MTELLILTPIQLRAAIRGESVLIPAVWPLATQGICPPKARVELVDSVGFVRCPAGRELLRLPPPAISGQMLALTDGSDEIAGKCTSVEIVLAGEESDELPRPHTPSRWAWAIEFDTAGFPQGKLKGSFSLGSNSFCTALSSSCSAS